MKHKFKIVTLSVLFSLLTATASVIGYTYAAYLNTGKYDNPLDINTSSFTSHFSQGGLGTEANPYKISTADDLRNLQKLTKLGVFHANTYFNMTNDITWSGAGLLPIGTEDTPFYSQFNGMGYIINNLVVDGANTNDIGMFGYVAITGRIRNLVLNAPIININTNMGGTRLPTTNPLESFFGDYARNSMGNITRVTSTSNSVTFAVPVNSLINANLNGGNPINIIYESSDTNLLYQSTTNPSQWITKSTPTSQYPSTDIYPVQLQARIYALYNNKIVSYTLERWQINVFGNGTVATDETGFYKTINPITQTHETYVGIFVGHLDGGASYLGLWGGTTSSTTTNGKIILNGRSARSYNVLVGRSRDDNDLDSSAADSYTRFVDFNTLINNKPALLNTDYLPNIASPGSTPINGTPTSLTHYNNFDSNVISYNQTNYGFVNVTTPSGSTVNEANFIRVYPTVRHMQTTFDTLDAEGNPLGQTNYGKAIRFNNPMAIRNFEDYYFLIIRRSRFAAYNALWFWATETYVSILNSIFGEATFQLQFKIAYVAKNSSVNNNFQVLLNDYTNSTTYARVGSNYWEDTSRSGIYAPNDYPLVANTNLNGVLQEKTLTLVINQSGGGWYNRTPMFAIGVGRGTGTTSAANPDYSNTSLAGSGSIVNYTSQFASDAFELYVFSFDILVTSADGNISSLLNYVDFLYASPTVSSRTGNEVVFSNWSKVSNVKMQFNGMNFNNVIFPTTYRFWRTAGFSGGVNSIVNGIYTTSSPYNLYNTSGYSNGTITSGAA